MGRGHFFLWLISHRLGQRIDPSLEVIMPEDGEIDKTSWSALFLSRITAYNRLYAIEVSGYAKIVLTAGAMLVAFPDQRS